MAYHNWDAERYVVVAEYAHRRCGLAVVHSSGPCAVEYKFARIVSEHRQLPHPQPGRKQSETNTVPVTGRKAG